MPAFLIPVLAFVKKHAVVLAAVGAAIVLLGSIMFVYNRAHEAGQREVEIRVERQHTETIREVRADEKLAQEVADRIAADIAATNERQRVDADTILKEIRNELPAPSASGPAPVAVSPGVLARSNELVDRANRAAGATQSSR